MRPRQIQLVILAATLLVTAPTFAYRPLLTEDAAVGALLEEAVEGSWFMLDEGNGEYSQNMLWAFIIGLGRAELMFEVPYTFNGPNEGQLGFLVGGKLIMWGTDEKSGLLTAKVEYSTSAIRITAPEGVVGISAIYTKDFGPVALHGQGGWFNNFNLHGGFFGVGADYMALPWLSVVGEITGEYNEDQTPTRALLGLIFKPTDWLAIDIAGTKSITSDAAMWSLQSGLTFIFPTPQFGGGGDDPKPDSDDESQL